MGVHTAHNAESSDHAAVSHQFEDIGQQNEIYIVGMWTFLVTEIMFFGVLFFAYVLYRWKFGDVFYEAHKVLNVRLGFINTTVLLTSSLFMALGVRSAMLKNRKMTLFWLISVIVCAFAFMVIKYFEYSAKIAAHEIPGPFFQWHGPGSAGQAEIFFSLYFAMTGLHGIHVLIGIITLGILAWMVAVKHKAVDDYMPIEMFGLYWHFVDIVWIFLFPLFYLMPHG